MPLVNAWYLTYACCTAFQQSLINVTMERHSLIVISSECDWTNFENTKHTTCSGQAGSRARNRRPPNKSCTTSPRKLLKSAEKFAAANFKWRSQTMNYYQIVRQTAENSCTANAVLLKMSQSLIWTSSCIKFPVQQTRISARLLADYTQITNRTLQSTSNELETDGALWHKKQILM